MFKTKITSECRDGITGCERKNDAKSLKSIHYILISERHILGASQYPSNEGGRQEHDMFL